jgi:hypothetical protein
VLWSLLSDEIHVRREHGETLRANVRGIDDALRSIVTVIRVYCQTGTPLSSSGGRTQVLLWDSQLYLDRVRHRETRPSLPS